jgi:hypothetical protein
LVLKKYLNIKEDFEVYSSLQAVAKKKGVPLMLPLMDLEDKRELTVDDILSAYSDKVLNGSRRYGVSAILSGAVISKRHCWSSEWTLHFDGKVKQWSLPCERLEQTLSVAMQGIYDQRLLLCRVFMINFLLFMRLNQIKKSQLVWF